MPVLVDTNVIADVLYRDPVWAAWSQEQLIAHADDLVINPFIYAELCYRAATMDDVERVVDGLGLCYEEMPRPALYLAAQAFRVYRQRGGAKSSPLADFFIGAHAAAAGLAILTRNVARYRAYFPSVALICP